MKIKNNKLEVKHYWSPDIGNPWGWEPQGNVVFYLLEMNIGVQGEDDSDVYSIMVATPEGILSVRGIKKYNCFSEVHKVLLLDVYCWGDVRKVIDNKLSIINSAGSLYFTEGLMGFLSWEYHRFV